MEISRPGLARGLVGRSSTRLPRLLLFGLHRPERLIQIGGRFVGAFRRHPFRGGVSLLGHRLFLGGGDRVRYDRTLQPFTR